MIRESEEYGRSSSRQSEARALLRSAERLLAKAGPVADQEAHEAQQLVYDAWEAATDEEEQQLIHRALELDPANVDALLQAVVYSGVQGEDEIELARKIVAVGEKALGPKTFKECKGGFWGFIPTRPYMRARQRLAECLRSAGRLDEAIREYEAMLELNPGDNQGVRYHLLPCYLMLNRLLDVQKLFAKYEEHQFNAVFAWGRVLERLLSGDPVGATQALAVARKQNPHLQGYIKGHRRMPRHLPDSYSPGSKEEAACFADVLQSAWSRHPTALQWLSGQK
jgi:tetratricopeptide (TPR) repeat protein